MRRDHDRGIVRMISQTNDKVRQCRHLRRLPARPGIRTATAHRHADVGGFGAWSEDQEEMRIGLSLSVNRKGHVELQAGSTTSLDVSRCSQA